MMRLDVGIEDHLALGEDQLFEKAFLHEEVERVVDRRPREHREVLFHPPPYLISRWMLVGLEHVLRDRNALRRRLNVALAQRCDQISFHKFRLSPMIDAVNRRTW